MTSANLRITEPGGPPGPEDLQRWMGPQAFAFWERVTAWIDENYPGVFAPDWLFGGKKHGWSLRYKKGKSFCTLIPEKDRFAITIVFGADERTRVENSRVSLSAATKKAYDAATVYHDGKWLLLAVGDDRTLADMQQLLTLKRRPKRN
jgi:hypothetical protein